MTDPKTYDAVATHRRIARRATRRGFALLLVLITVAIASIAALTFLASQSTMLGISENQADHAQARAVAEGGVDLALEYIGTHANWRTTMPHGTWMISQPLSGGTCNVTVEDGEDTDGDGVVDGDADLTDDPNDPVTITSLGSFGSTTHTSRVAYRPTQAGAGGALIIGEVVVPLPGADSAEHWSERP